MESANTSPNDGQRLPSLAVMDAVRATLAVYRRRFTTIVLTVGLITVPNGLLPALIDLSLDWPTPERPAARSELLGWVVQSVLAGVLSTAIPMVTWGVLSALIGGATVLMAVRLVNDQPVSIIGACRAALTKLMALVLADLLTWVAVIGVAVTCVGILALPYVILGLGFVTQAVVLEQCGPIAALRRSWQLCEGQRWRILLCELTMSLPGLVLAGAWLLTSHWLTGTWKGSEIQGITTLLAADPVRQTVWIIERILGIAETLVLGPLTLILTVVLYLDLRAREAPYQLPTRPAGPSNQDG